MVIMEYKNNIRKTVWVVDMGVGNTGLEMSKIGPKIGKNGGPKFVFSGAPGRGVLRFFARAYRNSVHFLPFFHVFSLFLQI